MMEESPENGEQPGVEVASSDGGIGGTHSGDTAPTDDFANEGGGADASSAPSKPSESASPATTATSRRSSLMDAHGIQTKSLEDQANCMSDLFLSYLSPLLRHGAANVIDVHDIGVPSERDRAGPIFDLAHNLWQDEMVRVRALNDRRRKKYDAKLAKMPEPKRLKAKPFKPTVPSIARILAGGYGWFRIAWAIFLYICSALLGFVPVLLLNDLVRFFETGADMSNWTGVVHPWVEVVALGVLPLLISLLQTRSQTIFLHLAIFVRTAVSTLLYEKSLSVSAAGRAATSTGQVVNMMSNDTTQLQRFIQFGGMTLVAPIQIIIALVLIYQQVGNATWVGVGFMVSLAPVNVVVFSVVGKMRRKVLKYSDLRVKMMNEILSGIRIIKYYAWERAMGKEVGKLRESELRALTNLAYTSAIGFSLILLSAPIIQPILVFLTYINIQDVPLSAATAFTTVALFNIMRFPFAFLPMGMLQFIQSRISLRRLAKYLELPELEVYVVPGPHPDIDASSDPDDPGAQVGSITMKKCSFAWSAGGEKVGPIDDSDEKKKRKKERRASRRRSSRGSQASQNGGGDDLMSTAHSLRSGATDVEKGPDDYLTLRDITCTIEAGSLVAIVGTVGCGKSSFLSAILGEMEPVDGSKVYIPRDEECMSSKADRGRGTNFVSYSAQTPWVVNDTLRGNVLFGRAFDQDRYDRVVEACALLDDLAVLPAGDMTEIGEKGINLSGGQKARVSLARAMYSDQTKLLLLDDPLSAVDAHVGEHLFRRAITGDVSRGTTRLLVTHHVHYLPRCDVVIVLEDGRIKHYGKYADLVEQGVDFHGAVDVSKAGEEEAPPGAGGDAEDKASCDDRGDEKETVAAAAPEAVPEKASEKVEAGEASKEKPKAGEATDDELKATMKQKGENLTSKEEKEEGSIAGSAYTHYGRAGGVIAFFSMFLIQGLGRAAEIMASFWLSIWAQKNAEATIAGLPLTHQETSRYLNIYAAFGIAGVVGLTARSILMAIHRLHASRKLHNDLVGSVLRAPVAFFDVTPTGRILNRFAADMDKIDLDLTQSIGQGMSTVFSVLGAIGAIVAATKGTFLVALIPLGYVYYLIQRWFRRTSTELQRVTSISISPIFADFSQVLSGTSTIRAYAEQTRFFAQCQASFDNFNACFNVQQLCNFWLGLRLDLLGGFIGFFIGAVSVGTAQYNFIPAGWLGLALSYAIEVTGYLKHGVRMIATVEADMNSVERVLYYSESIESEAPEVILDKDPDSDSWPSKGTIEFENASMRYRDGPLVLKEISLTINGGEKIGVVGRTGSGKSSLMNLLFRITEPEKNGGKVVIDGVNTTDIGTLVLRMNLSIIPQDPVMFSNTVRYNMDPFASATDEELWAVLDKVQLGEVIASLPGGLDDQVAEGGENFSQGQRQLLCIARSLLRNPKILVMDEATASIDNKTDAAIQKMIRENFHDATVLTIAHRLGTIMDSDRVLVLDDGRIAEFDTPSALLAKTDGIFKSMVEKSKAAHTDTVEE